MKTHTETQSQTHMRATPAAPVTALAHTFFPPPHAPTPAPLPPDRQEYTQAGGVRPFGVSLLVAGYDDDGPQLFQVDPSGAYYGWKASAIGKNFKNARSFLEKRYNDDVELDDAIHTALLTMREGFEGEMTEHTIEVGIVGEDRVFRVLTPAEVKDFLDEST